MRRGVSLLVLLVLVLGMVGVPVSANAAHDFTVVLKNSSISDADLAAIAKAGGTVVSRIDEIGVLQVRASDTTGFLKQIIASDVVESVGPSLEVQLEPGAEVDEVGTSPIDPANPADYLWGIDRVTNNGAAWDIHSGTKDVVVGIIDTGLDFAHPDLAANVVPGSKTFVPGTADAWDEHSHGTHVAGTIAANGLIKGVAPNVGIRAYRVFGATGGASQIWITNAIVAAANDGVDVINMSLGGFRVRGQWWYVVPGTGERIRLGNDAADIVAYIRAIRYAVQKNVTVVAAAGNDSWDLTKRASLTKAYEAYLHSLGYTAYEIQGATLEVPGGIPGVITVSAMGAGFGTSDRLAFYSNYGVGSIDLTAPGGDLGPMYPIDGSREADYYKYLILSTVPTYMNCSLPQQLFGDCNYGFKGGTSMASPHVAGAAALYISAEYARTGRKPLPSQVETALMQSADDIGKVGADAYYGNGLVNAYNAVSGK